MCCYSSALPSIPNCPCTPAAISELSKDEASRQIFMLAFGAQKSLARRLRRRRTFRGSAWTRCDLPSTRQWRTRNFATTRKEPALKSKGRSAAGRSTTWCGTSMQRPRLLCKDTTQSAMRNDASGRYVRRITFPSTASAFSCRSQLSTMPPTSSTALRPRG